MPFTDLTVEGTFSNMINSKIIADKPRIDVGAVRDITVKAGQEFKINVPFTAFPKPTALWSRGDYDLDQNEPRTFQKVKNIAI